MGFACRAVRAAKSAGPGAAGMQLSKRNPNPEGTLTRHARFPNSFARRPVKGWFNDYLGRLKAVESIYHEGRKSIAVPDKLGRRHLGNHPDPPTASMQPPEVVLLLSYSPRAIESPFSQSKVDTMTKRGLV